MDLDKKVLVVEDEDEVIDFVSAVLEENGFKVMIAKDGQEALQIIKDFTPDLIILDVLMPKKGGIKFYKEVKGSPSFQHIPVVIYSGIAKRTFLRTLKSRSDMEDNIIPMPDAYIEKPTKAEYFEKVIKDVLSEIRENQ